MLRDAAGPLRIAVMSLFRTSLAWSSYCLLALVFLPSLVLAKQNFGYPNTGVRGFANRRPIRSNTSNEFGVTSPSFPDTKAPGFTDHSSMSPDSWSAPPTSSVVQSPITIAPTQTVPQNFDSVNFPSQVVPSHTVQPQTVSEQTVLVEQPPAEATTPIGEHFQTPLDSITATPQTGESLSLIHI